MDIKEWIIKGRKGISSETMWAAITGTATGGRKGGYSPCYDVPYDPSDFKRCLDFVNECNVSKEQLLKVKEIFKWWSPFIDNWDKLVELYKEESPSGRCPKLFLMMQELEDESKRLDGWVQTGKYSWERKD